MVQPMPGVQSAAMTLMIPAGAAYDQTGRSGTAAVLAEMIPRGAGSHSARELSAAMDSLGLQRNVSAGVGYLTFSGATTADRIVDALPLIASQVTSPQLAEDQFAPAIGLVGQGLNALLDEPRQRLGHALRKCSYPAPWGNPAEGSLDDLPNLTLEDIRGHRDRLVIPNNAVMGVAGNVNATELEEVLTKCFADWKPGTPTELPSGDCQASPLHIEHDSAQTHIGIAWDTIPYSHDRYFEGWAAVSILSGGMSSRLFTEVREKRALCYAISASINTQVDKARVFGYAGSTNDRAQETLDVMVAEIRRLHEGMTDEELNRCKARAKSALIMQQESTMSRAGSLARDTLFLGRVRPLDEVRAKIDALTVDQVRNFAEEYAPKSMVLVTIGPEELNPACVAG